MQETISRKSKRGWGICPVCGKERQMMEKTGLMSPHRIYVATQYTFMHDPDSTLGYMDWCDGSGQNPKEITTQMTGSQRDDITPGIDRQAISAYRRRHIPEEQAGRRR